ncbi:TIGR04222 domain-containing membrane protein [Plantactinospora sp. S1510]|uniref:TIGR04222 domain-containing membrane protein n=1 Tax=Plantactinospora alkalitolerans TaxID=2789879 RepID=A0ABS0GWE8_9ACTN|nr:TIGR04222 domain-containing membrane protein [Plantactinospora alkalitolerans]MBF9130212.1 TIGR04222 domain-containing membrane protein [Plantactinospora alkalitolerans]
MTDPSDASTTDLGYLSGGPWAAVRAALVKLHVRGLVVADRPGGLRRTGALPAGVEPLERALFGALYGSMAPREVANQQRVRRALAEQREDLIGLGLLRPSWHRVLLPAMLVLVPPTLVGRLVAGDLVGIGTGLVMVLAFGGIASWFLPRRTVSGARLLRAARRRHPFPVGGEPKLDPGLAAALYGAEGMLTTVPQLAREGGLLGGGRWSRFLGDSPLDGSSVPAGAATGGF